MVMEQKKGLRQGLSLIEMILHSFYLERLYQVKKHPSISRMDWRNLLFYKISVVFSSRKTAVYAIMASSKKEVPFYERQNCKD